ncbi:MAG: hypothetical protein HYV41_03960 [Candidatus Magasanikbacteria bacterium]|nr:hypothetical protein [Candidatus Magasanikbacteria bacterium]
MFCVIVKVPQAVAQIPWGVAEYKRSELSSDIASYLPSEEDIIDILQK